MCVSSSSVTSRHRLPRRGVERVRHPGHLPVGDHPTITRIAQYPSTSDPYRIDRVLPAMNIPDEASQAFAFQAPVQAEVLTDRDAIDAIDGGPSATAMAHLDVVMAAGRTCRPR